MKNGKFLLIAAAVCAAVGVFFYFALIGYSFMAYLFWGICALCICYYLLNRYALKKLRVILSVLLVIGILFFIAVEIPIVAAARTSPEPQADYLIVLGAGVNGTVPSLSMKNRCDAALRYLEEYPDALCIASGGQGPGEEITEARAMFDYLTKNGIDPERVILEEKATSTKENLEYSLEIIEQRGGGSIAIVSSEYHLYRAKLMAKMLGQEVKTVAGHTSYPVLMINYFIREAFAVVHLWVFGW